MNIHSKEHLSSLLPFLKQDLTVIDSLGREFPVSHVSVSLSLLSAIHPRHISYPVRLASKRPPHTRITEAAHLGNLLPMLAPGTRVKDSGGTWYEVRTEEPQLALLSASVDAFFHSSALIFPVNVYPPLDKAAEDCRIPLVDTDDYRFLCFCSTPEQLQELASRLTPSETFYSTPSFLLLKKRMFDPVDVLRGYNSELKHDIRKLSYPVSVYRT